MAMETTILVFLPYEFQGYIHGPRCDPKHSGINLILGLEKTVTHKNGAEIWKQTHEGLPLSSDDSPHVD